MPVDFAGDKRQKVTAPICPQGKKRTFLNLKGSHTLRISFPNP